MDNKTELTIYAWQYITDTRVRKVLNSKVQVINYFFQDETEIDFTDKEISYINENNIKINCITIDPDIDAQKNLLIELGLRVDLINFYSYPTYWFLKTKYNLAQANNSFYLNNIEKNNFIYPFLSFNGKAKYHRSKLIDNLVKFNLIGSGVVTYHLQDYRADYIWEYHDGTVLTIDDNYTNNNSSYEFNEKFIQSFLHIIAESSPDRIIISEKTATPILSGLPFLVLGAHGFHQYLKDLGFLLYDEIFDYSFDLETDLENRIDKLLKNVLFVVDNKHRLNELYLLIKDKVEYNRLHAEKLTSSIASVPEILKDYYYNIIKQDTPIYSEDLLLIELFNNFVEVEKKEVSEFISKFHIRYYDYWYNFSYEAIIEDIKNNPTDEIVIFGENEWDVWVNDDFVKLVNEHDARVIYTTMAAKSNHIKNLGINNLEIQHWPTFYFRYSTEALRRHIVDKKFELKYPFICLNNRAHLHRFYVIDYLSAYDLLDKGIISWIDPLNEVSAIQQNFGITFKHFDGRQLLLSDNMKVRQDSYIIPDEYRMSLFDFVTECCYETIAISEKIIKPLVLKKPFVVMGGVGINNYLKQLGFELYDEIIDYSFDLIEDLEERSRLYVKNMEKVSKITNLDEVYLQLLPKINHNYNRCIELSTDMNIPEIVREILPIVLTNPFDDELGCLVKYKRLFKDII
jgi:hypothetical protein